MSKIAKSMAILGVVAGLGVAALPLSSYAADGSAKSGDVTVRVEVNSSLAVASSESDINLGTINVGTPVREGTTDVSVTTTSVPKYYLYIQDKDDNNALTLTDADGAILSGATAAQKIFAVGEKFTLPADGSTEQTAAVVKGSTGWGFKGGLVGDFTAVPTNGSAPAAIVEDGSFTDGAASTTVTFGVSAGAGLDDGIYKDTVVFIASPVAL